MKKYKLIACNVFKRELEYLMPLHGADIDGEFLELGEHARPAQLREKLQARIDASEGYAAVLLAYGLCGRATDGLRAGRQPLILPRGHDCGTLLLGSRQRFSELFAAMPSTPFSSVGFVEHGDYFYAEGELQHGDSYAALVERYGEEDARYIYEAMHPRLDGELQPVYFIEAPELPFPEARETCRLRASADGREFRHVAGSLRLLRGLLAGEWPEADYLTVPPGACIRQTGDWDQVFRSCAPEPSQVTPQELGII